MNRQTKNELVNILFCIAFGLVSGIAVYMAWLVHDEQRQKAEAIEELNALRVMREWDQFERSRPK